MPKVEIHGHWTEPCLTGLLPLFQNRPSGTTLGICCYETFEVVEIDENVD